MAHDIFICHAVEDRQLANALAAGLEAGGISCWIAPRDVPAGADYAQAIVSGISSAKALVLVFSRHSNESPHVGREVERGVSRGIDIIPYRVEDVVPSASLEYFISTSQWLDATAGRPEDHVTELAGIIRIRVMGESAEAPRRAAADVLGQIIERYGSGIADDPRRLRALLRDMSSVHPAEVAALVAAAEEGVGAALMQSAQGLTPEAERRLARRLEDHRALTEDAAAWAVAAWSHAVGVEEPPAPAATTPATGELPETVAAVAPAPSPEPVQVDPGPATIPAEDAASPATPQPVAAGQAATVAASPGVASRARPVPRAAPQPAKRGWAIPAAVGAVVVGAFAAGAFLVGGGGDDGVSETTRTTAAVTTTVATGGTNAAFFTFDGLVTDDVVNRYPAEASALGLPSGCAGLQELMVVDISTDRLEPGESFVWGRFAAPYCDAEIWGISDGGGALRELTVQVAEPTAAAVELMRNVSQALVGAVGYPEAGSGFAADALDRFGWLDAADPTTHQGETRLGSIQLGTFLHEGGYTFYMVPSR